MEIHKSSHQLTYDRLASDYLNIDFHQSQFTVSDAYSLGVLLNACDNKKRNKHFNHYNDAYHCVCKALGIENPDLFLAKLSMLENKETWDDFSDFNAVWYPIWFAQQIKLRNNLLHFSSENPDIASEALDKLDSADVKDSITAMWEGYQQLKFGMCAVVFRIDKAISSMLGWPFHKKISWDELHKNFNYPIRNELKKIS